jgi:tubulin monoglycylase TTLL3/8
LPVNFNFYPIEFYFKFKNYSILFTSDKVPFEHITDDLIEQVIRVLEEMKKFCPQYNIDGYRNIWIVKPGALSRGRGK